MHEQQAALEALATIQDQTREMRTITSHLRDLFRRHEQPAQLKTIELRGALSGHVATTDDVGTRSPSIGVVNPTSVTIFLGIPEGSPTRPGGRAFSIPANTAWVLPFSVGDLEIGADAAAIGNGNTAVIWLLRFKAVQPFFSGPA